MKKILSTLILLSLLISSLIIVSTVSGANNAVLAVGSIEATAGETVTVDITIENNPGILGMTLKVTYDESILTLTAVKRGDAMSALTFTPPKNLSSGCMLPFDALEIYDEDIKDGTVATLTFAVAENADAGSTGKIYLSYNDGAIIDNDLNVLDIDLREGSVTVKSSVVPGDVNGDGRVTAKDCIMLKAYIAGESNGYEIDIKIADTDKNGRLNAKDVLFMKKLIS